MNNKALIYLFLLFSNVILGQADPHFSLVNDVPVYLNPANLGSMDGSVRGSVIYRNQWKSVSVPFETVNVFADFNSSINNRFINRIGWGIQIINDRLGSGGLNKNMINVGASIPYYLTNKRNHLISGGFNLGIYQMNIDVSKLNFESNFNYNNVQFNNLGNPLVQDLNDMVMDFGLGFDYKYFDKESNIYQSGISFNHVGGGKLALNQNENTLNIKTNFYLTANYQLNDFVNVVPMLLMNNQGSFNEMVLGSEFVYALGRRVIEKIDIKGGMYYRWSDALIVTFGMNHENLSFNFGYDINTSGLNVASNGQGAFEFSITYVNRMFKGYKDLKYVVPGNRLF